MATASARHKHKLFNPPLTLRRSLNTMPTTYRPIEKADLKDIGRVFVMSLNHRHEQMGEAPVVDLDDAEAWEDVWQNIRRPLFEHVSAHAGTGWLAEQDGEISGYARSIQRDGVCQLTELFVAPDKQLAGVGRELLLRAFVQVESPSRLILANNNPAALSRYMRAGVYPVCAIFDVERKARRISIETSLETRPISADAATIECLNQIDRAILGYIRPEEHAWLCTQRTGTLFLRQGVPAGYAYAGRWNGPIAALEASDMPALLAHAETIAAETGETFGLMVPVPNRTAMLHAVNQGFALSDAHTMYFMADFSPPGLDRYILSMPGFFT